MKSENQMALGDFTDLSSDFERRDTLTSGAVRELNEAIFVNISMIYMCMCMHVNAYAYVLMFVHVHV